MKGAQVWLEARLVLAVVIGPEREKEGKERGSMLGLRWPTRPELGGSDVGNGKERRRLLPQG